MESIRCVDLGAFCPPVFVLRLGAGLDLLVRWLVKGTWTCHYGRICSAVPEVRRGYWLVEDRECPLSEVCRVPQDTRSDHRMGQVFGVQRDVLVNDVIRWRRVGNHNAEESVQEPCVAR